MGNQTVKHFSRLVTDAKELTGKEKDILLKRLQNKTLEQIGKQHMVSLERIRQIEREALRKLNEKIRQLLLFE